MLTSLALIFLTGMLLGSIAAKLRLPSLLGMLMVGILLGPHVLNLIDESLLHISAELRQLALVIILARAGLSLDLHDLKQVGRPALLLCFLPASCEILATLLLAPRILGISLLDAAIMGSVIAAVSPAVVVPRMLKMMEEGYGTDKSIPQLIMAGASVDDVFVIVLFTSFTSLAGGSTLTPLRFAAIPMAILSGLIAGALTGWLLSRFFRTTKMGDPAKAIVLLSVSLLPVSAEKGLEPFLPFSGLLAVMAVGIALLRFSPENAEKLSATFSKLWIVAEILLFVLVGATVDIAYAASAGASIVLLLAFTSLFRMAGVRLCLLRTKLNRRERLFCMVAYVPKATVQAAIGAVPLAMGLSCGNLVLTVAILSILLTAPLGALGIDLLYRRCLNRTKR